METAWDKFFFGDQACAVTLLHQIHKLLGRVKEIEAHVAFDPFTHWGHVVGPVGTAAGTCCCILVLPS
jgi:hypothetical protein